MTEQLPADDVEMTDVPVAEPAEEKDDAVPTEEMVRAQLKGLPGKWYVLHTYAGYENRVKRDLENRIQTMDMEDKIFQVEVPMETVLEVKKDKQQVVSRVRMPGYALVRMYLDEDSYRVVAGINGVSGFVGNGRNAVPLTENEVVAMFTPVVEAEAAAARANDKRAAVAEILTDYTVGETVILTTEPWVGMEATVSDVDGDAKRLTVLMTLVGQETPVELGFDQVRKSE